MTAARIGPKLADRRIPAGGDFLDPAEVAKLTPEIITQRIRDLHPLIAAHAAEAEAQRRPHDAVWQAIRDTGFFYQFVPRKFGGMESGFQGFIDTGMAIAEVDPSTSWCATFCAEHNWIFSHFPAETHAEIWGGDFPYIVAPMVSMPPGKAVKVEGGYRVNAHWRWGTGVMHADWVMGNVLLDNGSEPPSMLMVMVPADQAEVLDTWNCSGMTGTGSNDIVLRDVFIPERFTVPGLSRGGSNNHDRSLENPIYGVPMLPFLAMSAAIPAAGAARGMVNIFRERIGAFARPGSDGRMADKAPPQIRLARADTLARSAEVLIRDVGNRLVSIAEMTPEEATSTRLGMRAQLSYAVSLCREAGMVLIEAAGTSIHMRDQAFQRLWRDLVVVTTHIVFDPDIAYEQHGRAMVGLPPNTPLN